MQCAFETVEALAALHNGLRLRQDYRHTPVPVSPGTASVHPPNGPPNRLYPPETATQLHSQPTQLHSQPPVTALATTLETSLQPSSTLTLLKRIPSLWFETDMVRIRGKNNATPREAGDTQRSACDETKVQMEIPDQYTQMDDARLLGCRNMQLRLLRRASSLTRLATSDQLNTIRWV